MILSIKSLYHYIIIIQISKNLYQIMTHLHLCSAAEEEDKVKLIEEDVALKQRLCAEDLEKAEPALIAAQAALDTLNKVNYV